MAHALTKAILALVLLLNGVSAKKLPKATAEVLRPAAMMTFEPWNIIVVLVNESCQ